MRRGAYLDNPEQQQNKRGDYQNRAQHPPLFGKSRKDKIGGCRRQKTQLNLRPLLVTFAKKSGGTDGDLLLNHVVVETQRVIVWIHESEDAFFLVRFQKEIPG